MRVPRMTTRRMMVAVAIAAGLLSLQRLMSAIVVEAGLLTPPDAARLSLLAPVVPCLAWALARRLVSRGHRRLAACGFAALAILINVSYAAVCSFTSQWCQAALLVGWLFLVLPTLANLGAAWTALATRDDAHPRRSPRRAWLAVVALTAMPMVTILSLWPIRLSFLIARPALERLADRASAGEEVGEPRWAGPFRIVSSFVEPTMGGVVLVIEPYLSPSALFVRVDRRIPVENHFVPFSGMRGDVPLGWGWWYTRSRVEASLARASPALKRNGSSMSHPRRLG
jgi:hypothetical protein